MIYHCLNPRWYKRFSSSGESSTVAWQGLPASLRFLTYCLQSIVYLQTVLGVAAEFTRKNGISKFLSQVFTRKFRNKVSLICSYAFEQSALDGPTVEASYLWVLLFGLWSHVTKFSATSYWILNWNSVRHLLKCDSILSDEFSARIFKADWLLSWKQTQHIPGKLREISTSLQGVTFQRTRSSKSVSIQIDKIYLLLIWFRKRQSWLSFFFVVSVQPVNTCAGCTQALLCTSLPVHANSSASVVIYTEYSVMTPWTKLWALL
jgi:predicted small integral membrane protein